MSLDVETGVFARQSGTGNQVVSLNKSALVGKAIMFWGGEPTAEGYSANNSPFQGFAKSSTERGCYAYFSPDADGAGVGATRGDNANCIVILSDETPTIGGEADFVSFAAGEFTINWGTNDGTLSDIHYKIWGGDDLTGIHVGSMSVPASSTGQFSNTALSFTGKVMFHIGMGKITTLPSNQTKMEKHFFGCAASSSKRWCAGVSFRVQVGGANKCISNFEDTKTIITVKSATQNEVEIDFVSFNTDGFTMDVTTSKGDFQIIFMVLGGTADFEADVGTDTQRITTIGTKATTTTFEPEDLFLASCSQVDGGAVDGKWIFGASDGVREQTYGSLAEDNPTTDTKCDDFQLTTKVLRMATPGAPPTTDAEADFDSFNATDFTLDWTTVDGVAREFGWCVMKGASAAANELAAAVNLALTVSPDLKAQGAVGADVNLILAVVADLQAQGELAAAAALAFTLAPDLKASDELSAAALLAFSAVADLKAQGKLDAAAALALSLAADLRASGDVSAAVALAFTLAPDLTSPAANELSASVLMALSLSPSLTATGGISASVAMAFSAVANLQAQGQLDAAAALAFSIAADLRASGDVGASIAMMFSVAASLSGAGTLAATPALIFSAVADLVADGQLDAAAALAFTLAPDLTGLGGGDLTAAVAMAFSLSAGLSAAGTLAAAPALVLSVSPDLRALAELNATASMSFSVSADMESGAQLDAAPELALSVAADLAALGSIDAAPAMAFSVSPDLQAAAPNDLTASVALAFTPSIDLTARGALLASVLLQFSVSANILDAGAIAIPNSAQALLASLLNSFQALTATAINSFQALTAQTPNSAQSLDG